MFTLLYRGLHFGPFRFDPRRRTLFKRGERVALRAKAVDVLELLLEHADHIVSKQTLRTRVWGHDGVSDQSLFQAVSDIRRALAPIDAIITHPNQGYRLAMTVSERRVVPLHVAATLAPLVAVVMVAFLAGPDRRVDPALPALSALSPSMQAFVSGAAHLNAGEPAAAQSMLALALQENAQFDEARLMLAEAYLVQGKHDRALEEARRVLEHNDARTQPDAHASVAAMSLISRVEDSAGEPSRALHWAFEAAQRAHRGGLACTASDIEQRIDQLLARRDDARPSPLSATSRLAQPKATASRQPIPDFCAKFPSFALPPEAHTVPVPCSGPAVAPRLAALVEPAKTVI